MRVATSAEYRNSASVGVNVRNQSIFINFQFRVFNIRVQIKDIIFKHQSSVMKLSDNLQHKCSI